MTFQELLNDERKAGRAEGISLGVNKKLKELVEKKVHQMVQFLTTT